MRTSVDHRDGSSVVPIEGMVQKCDEVASRGDPGMTDPSRRLIDRLAGRKLEAVLPGGVADDDELSSVRHPVRPVNVLEQLARSSPG